VAVADEASARSRSDISNQVLAEPSKKRFLQKTE
jgi:hypothetical protein